MATLAANALVDLQTVKDELGFTDSTYDNLLTARINRASSMVEKFVQRTLRLQYLQEYISVPATRSPRVETRDTPISAVQAVYEDARGTLSQPALVDPSDYQLEEAFVGWLYRGSRWKGTAIRRPDIVQDFDPGTDESTLLVQYVAGYITQVQALAAAGWPGAAASVTAGTLLADGHGGLWMATVDPGTTGATSAQVGSVQPTWATTGLQQSSVRQDGLHAGSTQADGGVVWAYMGTVGAAGAGNEGTAETLPQDLKGAVVDTVVSLWTTRGQDTNVKSESISGIASQSFGDRGLFPPTALPILERYRRLVVQ